VEPWRGLDAGPVRRARRPSRAASRRLAPAAARGPGARAGGVRVREWEWGCVGGRATGGPKFHFILKPMACGPRGSGPGARTAQFITCCCTAEDDVVSPLTTRTLSGIAPGAARAPDRAVAIAQHSEVVCRAVVRTSRPDHSLLQMLPHLHTSRWVRPGGGFRGGLAHLLPSVRRAVCA
jgi:hypothetical protein